MDRHEWTDQAGEVCAAESYPEGYNLTVGGQHVEGGESAAAEILRQAERIKELETQLVPLRRLFLAQERARWRMRGEHSDGLDAIAERNRRIEGLERERDDLARTLKLSGEERDRRLRFLHFLIQNDIAALERENRELRERVDEVHARDDRQCERIRELESGLADQGRIYFLHGPSDTHEEQAIRAMRKHGQREAALARLAHLDALLASEGPDRVVMLKAAPKLWYEGLSNEEIQQAIRAGTAPGCGIPGGMVPVPRSYAEWCYPERGTPPPPAAVEGAESVMGDPFERREAADLRAVALAVQAELREWVAAQPIHPGFPALANDLLDLADRLFAAAGPP